MDPRARVTSLSARSIRTWLQFALGVFALVGIATAIDLANSSSRAPLGGQALGSLVFALELVAGAGVAATLLWLGMRAVKGPGADDFRDSVLWSAYLIAAFVMLTRVLP